MVCIDKLFGKQKNYITFVAWKTGRSTVRLAHLLWEQGVASSNLATPTIEKEIDNQIYNAIIDLFSYLFLR